MSLEHHSVQARRRIGARLRPADDLHRRPRRDPPLSNAVTLRVDGPPLGIDALLREANSSESKRIAFVIPPGRTWPLPVYELALMAQPAHEGAGV